jgi:WD40 repeat protein
MTLVFGRSLLFHLPFTLLIASFGAAQQNCPLPPSVQGVSQGDNIFSEQQEIDLGDAMAESLAQRVRIIHDDHLNVFLNALGNRVAQHLPPTQLKFRFYLMELPEVNAYSIAGGRVYVSRKLVALAKTDDELAGVLAHELGHIVTHQIAIEMTARLHEVLGVQHLGDRADVFEKFHLLLENAARKPGHGGGEDEKHQYVADQVALYAMARAGYAPHAFVDLWDRFQQTHGKTGSWLSDFFGGTKPSERRLREMLKNVAALPVGCADIPPGSRTAEFSKWQAEVISYSGLGIEESLPGLITKQVLARPLRPDISNLRFSPDGKYVLAQDEGGIHVLTRDPFAVLFYIPIVDAQAAVFTPDSRSLVFHNRSLRVESWSVAEQRRNWVHELTVLHPCFQSELSPDGSVLACLNSEFELSLIDVASESTLVSKKSFAQPTFFGACVATMSLAEGGEAQLIEMKFSPDARYFLAGANGTHFAWNLTARHELSLPGSVRDAMKLSFAFIGPDRLVGIDVSSPAKSPVLRFPSGERLQQLHLATTVKLSSATHGDYFFVGPLKKEPLGLFDAKNGTLPINFKKTGADIYDGTFVTERVTGELALNVLGKTDAMATVKLPQARLGPLRAAAISADFDWLLLSNRSRGAVWDVAHNIQTMELRSFQGAWFGPDQIAYLDFPKFMETEREIVRIDPVLGNSAVGYKIGDAIASQHGGYLLITKPKGGQSAGSVDLSPQALCLRIYFPRWLNVRGQQASDEEVELRDVRDGHVVWSHYFAHEVPSLWFGSTKALLRWPIAATAVNDELAKFPALKTGAAKTDYFLEQLDLRKDAPVAAILLKTNKGSFAVTHAFAEGDWLIASASGNQVLTYSMSSGQEKGHFFGAHPTASPNGLLAVETESGQLSIYDLNSSQLRQQYNFSDPVSFQTFSRDGNRLFVMTASQTAYIFDLKPKN